jgi:hypothetical protein
MGVQKLTDTRQGHVEASSVLTLYCITSQASVLNTSSLSLSLGVTTIRDDLPQQNFPLLPHRQAFLTTYNAITINTLQTSKQPSMTTSPSI